MNDDMIIFFDGQMARASAIVAVQKLKYSDTQEYIVRVLLSEANYICLDFVCDSEEEQKTTLKEISAQVQSHLHAHKQMAAPAEESLN